MSTLGEMGFLEVEMAIKTEIPKEFSEIGQELGQLQSFPYVLGSTEDPLAMFL